MKKLFISILYLLFFVSIQAQSEQGRVFREFPYGPTAEERQMLPTWYRTTRATTPPPGPVSALSEFQPMSGVMVAYYNRFGVPVSLLRELSLITQLKVLVFPASDSNTVKGLLSSGGVNMENVDYWVIDHNSYWTRDYGPWFILDGNGQLGVVDFTYNRPIRPKDDAAMVAIASKMGLPRYEMPLLHTGGNYMVDGYGTAASTDLVLEENPNMTAAEVRTLFSNYLGIDNYMLLNDPLGDYIAHIDCWGKFLDVDKVLIGQVSTTNSHYNEYEDAAATFANAFTPWGNHYQVYRVYTPGGEGRATPYTNSLILNNHVFVPITGSQWDDAAVDVYQQAMPGYTIVPIMQTFSAPWLNTDALHCRTHELADVNMLYVRHYPVLGAQPYSQSVTVEAFIKPIGDQSLICDSLLVYYRVNEGVWQSVPLALIGGDNFQAQITGLSGGDVVDYYIFAKDQSGRITRHPYIGAADPHRFTLAEVGIDRLLDEELAVYPNPCTDRIVVRLAHNGIRNIRICDIYGRLLFEHVGESNNITVSTISWPAGVYMVTVEDENGRVATRKLVKR